MYLTLSQTANELERTERQVRYLVKTGVLPPVNLDTFKRDGGYRFSQEVVEQLKEKLRPEGIPLRKAAEIVGITPQYLNSLALNGEIESQLIMIGNKKERRFTKEDCEAFRSKIRIKTHKSIAKFGEKLDLYNHIRLFNLIVYNEENVRVVKTKPITLLKSDGTLVQPPLKEDIPFSDEWEEKPYKTKKGFVTFKLPIPRNAEHTTYDILYKLIGGLGPKNIQVFEQDDGDYFIRCRQGKISLPQDYTELLKRYLVEGELSLTNENKVALQSNIVTQYIHLSRDLYETIENLANERNISTHGQLIDIIARGLNSLRKNEQ
jgi:DNA-binding transcriptional MerR regulator